MNHQYNQELANLRRANEKITAQRDTLKSELTETQERCKYLTLALRAKKKEAKDLGEYVFRLNNNL